MNTNWIKVFIAAFFEVFWVIGLKHADDFWTWTGTVISIIISFYLMIMAGRKLPVGTVYAVFVGWVLQELFFPKSYFFGEPFKVRKSHFDPTFISRGDRFEISYERQSSGRG